MKHKHYSHAGIGFERSDDAPPAEMSDEQLCAALMQALRRAQIRLLLRPAADVEIAADSATESANNLVH